jgi:hypothetical protein
VTHLGGHPRQGVRPEPALLAVSGAGPLRWLGSSVSESGKRSAGGRPSADHHPPAATSARQNPGKTPKNYAKKPPLTRNGEFPILAASRADPGVLPGRNGGRPGEKTRRFIHVDGSAPGNAATTGFLRTTKRKTAGKEACGTLRIYQCTGPGDRCPVTGPAAVPRPIAPGKASCPSPPWDAAFPGAFFCAVGSGRQAVCSRQWAVGGQRNATLAPHSSTFPGRCSRPSVWAITVMFFSVTVNPRWRSSSWS